MRGTVGVLGSIDGLALPGPAAGYAVVIGGLQSPEDITDSAAYTAAFHDVCGMPLIVDTLPPLSFTIDAACE